MCICQSSIGGDSVKHQQAFNARVASQRHRETRLSSVAVCRGALKVRKEKASCSQIFLPAILGEMLATGFCRVKFWAKFAVWRGAVRGEVFGEVFGAKFLAKFSGLFCWDIRSKKKTSAQKSHASAQQNWRKLREKLQLAGNPCQLKWLRHFYGRLGFFGSFCRKTPHAHKIPRFRGGDFGFLTH